MQKESAEEADDNVKKKKRKKLPYCGPEQDRWLGGEVQFHWLQQCYLQSTLSLSLSLLRYLYFSFSNCISTTTGIAQNLKNVIKNW